MAAKYWIKLYHEILEDPKMCRLSDRLYRRCIELFLLAGKTGDDGALPAVEDMAWHLRLDVAELLQDLQDLAKVGIVTEDEDGWLVTHFEDRQEAASSTERSRRHRERQKQERYYPKDMPEAPRGWQSALWKPLPKKPGVYMIECTESGKKYVGASKNVQYRVRQHLSDIAQGLHRLSGHYQEHGYESIQVQVLELAESEADLQALENKWMNQLPTEEATNVEPSKRNRTWSQPAGRTRAISLQIRPIEPEKKREEAEVEPEKKAPPPLPPEPRTASDELFGYVCRKIEDGVAWKLRPMEAEEIGALVDDFPDREIWDDALYECAVHHVHNVRYLTRCLETAQKRRMPSATGPPGQAAQMPDRRVQVAPEWELVLGLLSGMCERAVVDTWLRPCRVAVTDHTLEIAPQNGNAAEWIAHRLAGTLTEAVEGALGDGWGWALAAQPG